MLSTTRLDWRYVAVLLIGYVVLDWASFIHPLHGLNITPWNPAPALGLVFLLRFGNRMVLPIFVAIVVAEAWVRGMTVSLLVLLVTAALLTFGYWAIATVIHRYLAEGAIFTERRGLLAWTTIVVVGTLATSALFVLTLALSGYVPSETLRYAAFKFWIGDGTGVIVTMPLIWMLLDADRRKQLMEVVAQTGFFIYLLLVCAALWLAFGLGAETSTRYFYALFLPIAWAAARHGLPGAVIAAALIQFGIIVAVQTQNIAAITVLEVQILAAVITLFGFFIGIVVDEKQRVSQELKQTLRLAAAGEMAGALAHELNQPLTALTAYGSACDQLLERGETGKTLRDALQNMIRESHRAAEVLRRLRDFFRTGTTHLEEFDVKDLLDSVTASFAPRAQREAVTVSLGDITACRLLGDRMQLEVVLRNLLANAFDAVASQSGGERRIGIAVAVEDETQVCICIEDSGAGFDEAHLSRLFEGFQSTKSSGLGLGLMISRAIAEAHGGKLRAEVGNHGIVKLSLPIEGIENNAS
jgi:signal transduction histidine kinase